MCPPEDERPPAAAAAAQEDGSDAEAEPEPSSAEKAQMEAQMAMRRAIFAIMADTSLSDAEKAQRRQDLLTGKWKAEEVAQEAGAKKSGADKAEAGGSSKGNNKAGGDAAAAAGGGAGSLLEDTLKCVICFNLCERPVTSPCQHNFCLACFKRWLGQGKKTCPTCRAPFPAKFADNPRINTLLTHAIRCAKQGVRDEAARTVTRIADESRPAEAFTTERAVRAGRANAASGRIMVSVPNDHFGPILPEHDPTHGKGVQVGDWWKDRLDCRQWGAHFPHVAGIAGQASRGAQSVVLSGGYEDDHDEGEWFLYTGSGGRDLSGNKRTNKTQSFDQTFDSMNAALKTSCIKGLPVRVVRSFKEKRSAYAPTQETPVRYDGIYRILRCWRKKGAQGYLMCRYLFVRADNAPAPWTSDEAGDSRRLEVPELAAKEIKAASGTVFEMSDKPYWDYDEAAGAWSWAREAPPSQKAPGGGDAVKKLKKKASAHERLLRDFSCGLCKGVLDAPLSMPCGHNFCKACLDGRFAAAEAAAAASNGSKALAEAKPSRSLRVRKVPKPCPSCKSDLADYLSHTTVNTEMAELIRRLQAAAEEARSAAAQEAEEAAACGAGGAGSSKAAAAAAAAAAAGGGSDAEDGDEEEDEEQQDSEAEQEDEEEAAPAKKRRTASPVAADGGSSDAAAADATTADAPASAKQPQQQQVQVQQPAPQAPAVGGRYSSEVASLAEAFPGFEPELISMLLEDQGGDAEEVRAYLKRMQRMKAQEERQAAAAAAAGGSGAGSAAAAAGGKKKGGKKAKGGKAAAKAAAASAGSDNDDGDDAKEEAEEQQEQAAAAANGNGHAGASEEDAADTLPESDTDKAAAGGAASEAGGKKAAAAGGKKRRQSGSADGVAAATKKQCA